MKRKMEMLAVLVKRGNENHWTFGEEKEWKCRGFWCRKGLDPLGVSVLVLSLVVRYKHLGDFTVYKRYSSMIVY